MTAVIRKPAWAWCAHKDHNPARRLRDRRGRRPAEFRGMSVWHKLPGPWSTWTFCGQESRWMAPRKWLRTTDRLDRPALETAEDVKPHGLICEVCQSVSLHGLVPPGWPKFREPMEARIAGDFWEERGDERAAVCRAMAEPDWRPEIDAAAVVYGPWGRLVDLRSHRWERSQKPHDAGAVLLTSRDRGLQVVFRTACKVATRQTLDIEWEFDEPTDPCANCAAMVRDRDEARRLRTGIGDYGPFRNRALQVGE